MRVIVNAECTYQTRAGVGHHTGELLAALHALTAPGEIGEYPSGRDVSVVRFFNRHHERYRKAAERRGPFARAEALVRLGYLGTLKVARNLIVPNPLARAARGFDLYHEPNFLAHPCDLPTVVTVHDLSVLSHPEWHPAARVAKHLREFDRTLKQACHLFTVSEAMKAEIVRDLGWPAERISVTYNGRRPFLRPMSEAECAPVLLRLGLKPGYFLHVGTIEPRKNIGLLLKAHAGLPSELRQRHPLVLVGGGGWNASDLEAELARQKDGTVRRLGYVADADLSAVYSSARALVFPTLYEGFGMPTVEMLACGGAVLASTDPAVAEVVGAAAHLTDPRDEHGWRDALLRAATQPDWLDQLKRGAEGAARPFTWERAAHQALDGYRRAIRHNTDTKRAA